MSKTLTALAMLVSLLPMLAAGAEPEQGAPPEPDATVMKIEVHAVVLEPHTESPVVILRTLDKTQYLPIFVGESEAAAIWRYMNDVETPRPMAHDLLSNIINKLGGKVQKVTVTELKDNVFYARIEIATGEDTVTIDARPSDSIALALKMGAEVYVAKKVMDQAGRAANEGKQHPEEEREEKREENTKPQGRMPTAI